MKKGVLFGLAALAVGVVVLTLGKKEKPSNNPKPSLYKWLNTRYSSLFVFQDAKKYFLAGRTLLPYNYLISSHI